MLAHPVAEQVGGQRGVAQLADVGAGVGQAERAAVLLEQRAHAVLVVVGDDGLDPDVLQRRLGDREVEQQVERIDAALVGDARGAGGRRAPGWPSTP